MPANLPPQYFEAEKRFRSGRTPEEKIEALEEMLAIMPKHKGTDKLKALLRERISKLRDQSQKKKGTAKYRGAYNIDKEGALQVIVIGPPNTGKSSLIVATTNASPMVADFPHTTHKPTAGMVQYENIQFQLIDTPPLSNEYSDPALNDMIRRADLVIILLDILANPLEQLEMVMNNLHSARIYSDRCPLPEDLPKSPFVKTMLIALNKMDSGADEELLELFRDLSKTQIATIGISVGNGTHIQALWDVVFSLSRLVRVHTKKPGKAPDMKAPFVVMEGTSLEELAEKIHKDLIAKIKYAKVWGKNVRDGQMVQRDYIFADGDIVEMNL